MLALGERLPNFRVDLGRLDDTAQLVIDTTRAAYPSLDVPFHSRWRHFDIDGFDYWNELDQAMAWPSPAEKARTAFDLAIVSVLLDAGAGPELAISLSGERRDDRPLRGPGARKPVMFRDCEFSMWPSYPLAGRRIGAGRSHRGEARSRLPGVGRQSAARRRRAAPTCCGGSAAPWPRRRRFSAATTRRAPAGLFDHLAALAENKRIAAPVILSELLTHLGPIWPSRLSLGGVALGDCWRHSALKTDDETDGLVPLHKLSQWLAYSLIEPLQWAGIEVTDIDGLTGLGGIPQRRAVHRHRRAGAARSRRGATRARRRFGAGGGVARADRRAARSSGRRSCAHGSNMDRRTLAACQNPARRHLDGRARHRKTTAAGRRAAVENRQRRNGVLKAGEDSWKA